MSAGISKRFTMKGFEIEAEITKWRTSEGTEVEFRFYQLDSPVLECRMKGEDIEELINLLQSRPGDLSVR